MKKKINMITETSQNNSCYTTHIHNNTYGRQKKKPPQKLFNYVTNYTTEYRLITYSDWAGRSFLRGTFYVAYICFWGPDDDTSSHPHLSDLLDQPS